MNILFCCTGNTCRSPMAELLMKRELESRGIQGVAVRSAGLCAEAGEPISEGSRIALLEDGFETISHSATQLDRKAIEWADRIYVMSPSHWAAITAIDKSYEKKISVLAVPDPFGGSRQVYAACRDQLKKSVKRIAEELCANEI